MKLAILGTGKMGSAVGKRLAGAGYEIIYGSREPQLNMGKFADYGNISVFSYQDACRQCDVAIVAVPWAHTLPLLLSQRENLEGKVVVDLTNPLSADISHLVVPAMSSAAELIAGVLEKSVIVKAFNGITADNFSTPNFSGETAQVFFCGDVAEAKEIARELINACGYQAEDCGALSNARYLEAMAMLWLQLAFWENKGSGFSFRIVQKDTSLLQA